MTDINNEIIKRLDRQDDTLRDLTKSISEFAKIVARKEVQDVHFNKMHEDKSERLKDHDERLRTLEAIAAGDASKNQVRDWIWKAATSVAVASAAGGILWAIANQIAPNSL